MVSKITRGIKVQVKVYYVKEILHLDNLVYFFNYDIRIENQSADVVQLLSRYWHIKDALNCDTILEGEGVIGEKPIVKTSQYFEYTSSCCIVGATGSMQGYFTFINYSTSELFRVKVPLFKMNVPYIFN